MSALVTAVAYLGLLGWDQTKNVGVDGNISGPYDWWQVLALVLVLASVAVLAGRVHRPWSAAITCTTVLTLCWSVDAATDIDGDGLWPIGAALVALASALGLGFIGILATPRRR